MNLLVDDAMTELYSDLEDLRPLGEATQLPDDELAGYSGSELGRNRTEETLVEYPDDSTTTESECPSCGASIPTTQTKCRLCLTNYLGTSNHQPSDADQTHATRYTDFSSVDSCPTG